MGEAKVQIKGANNYLKGHNSLPVGLAAALSGSGGSTVQIFGNNISKCLGLEVFDVKKADGLVFEAEK